MKNSVKYLNDFTVATKLTQNYLVASIKSSVRFNIFDK